MPVEELRPVLRTLTRCLVCGSAEVRTDEVVDRGLVFLAECARCEHRWTRRGAEPTPRPPASRVLRVPAPTQREPATAA